MLATLAGRSIDCPLTVQLPMLPPSAGMMSQRSAPLARVRISIAALLWCMLILISVARRLANGYDSATSHTSQAFSRPAGNAVGTGAPLRH